MASGSTGDILMRIKKDGAFLGVAGESLTTIDKSDEFTKDFTPGKFVEIEDFDFGISLQDKDSSKSKKKKNKNKNDDDDDDDDDDKATGKFYKFTTGDPTALYPVTIDEISITRQIDSSSPILMTSCFTTKTVQQITIVKRKVAGTGGKLGNIAYLRVDFETVLITDMSWEVGDPVMKEKFKFVCRKITMKYRPQNADGSPGVVVNAGPLTLINTA